MRHLTDQENKILNVLGDAWNEFLKIKNDGTVTKDDVDDFRKAIHDAQRIVMSRPSQA